MVIPCFIFLVTLAILLPTIGGSQAGPLKETIMQMLIDDEKPGHDVQQNGTKWAVLVAGSFGFQNYRHQADVCHAYQLLKRGGLKDENIVVFMYDDIAMDKLNPRPGIIINHPHGGDVYAGVPKDYNGKNVTVENLYAVLLGNKSGVSGGSGKVVDSKPNDTVFLYLSNHGGPGVLEMPNVPFLYAKDFIKVLKKKHVSGSYKEMVIYLESCESGSIFEGLLPEDLNIYVTTASNAREVSWATYCPGMAPAPPPEYDTCLGDLYSVAWMEDSDTHNRKKETIKQQYQTVKKRTSVSNTYQYGSHVMEYGNKCIGAGMLHLFQGFDPSSKNFPPGSLHLDMEGVHQRDADILFLWQKYKNSKDRSEEKAEALKQITDTVWHRIHLDGSMHLIAVLLFGHPTKLNSVRAPGSPLVDDWGCLKSMVRLFETHCGSLTEYGMKHMRAFANLCNNGVSQAAMEEACMAACTGHDLRKWNPSTRGYSA